MIKGKMSSLPLDVVNVDADRCFRTQAIKMGLDPDSLWVGGYVQYEWNHIRHLLEAILSDAPRGIKVLEFGCNVGATTVVLASLGAHVTAVDVDIYNGPRIPASCKFSCDLNDGVGR